MLKQSKIVLIERFQHFLDFFLLIYRRYWGKFLFNVVFRVHVKFGESDDGKIIATLRFDSLSLFSLPLLALLALYSYFYIVLCTNLFAFSRSGC